MKRIVRTHGRAVIFDGKNPIYTLEVKTDPSGKKIVDVKPYENGLHLGMWLQPAMNTCSESACTEEAPFLTLQTQLIHWAWVEELISLFLSFANTSFSIKLRKLAVVEFEKALQETTEDARKEVERILLETTPPQGMSTRDLPFTGMSATLMEKFVEKFGHQSPEQTL